MMRSPAILFIMLLSMLVPAGAESTNCSYQVSDIGLEKTSVICTAATLFNIILANSEESDAMKDTGDKESIHHQHFHYRIDRPANPSGNIIVLLHGSGGDETSLFPFAKEIWPRAILIGIRGRIVQDGETRWYRKITPVRFDEHDVKHEADALVHFLTLLVDEREYDISRIIFVGYSNGANLLAVMMMGHPDLVRRAVLMRSMPVLDKMPEGNLRKAQVLTISGKNDVLYSPFAPTLASLLKTSGARVESFTVEGDHMIDEDDIRIIKRWAGNPDSDGISAMSRKESKNRK